MEDSAQAAVVVDATDSKAAQARVADVARSNRWV
jgi:hypothetical protein